MTRTVVGSKVHLRLFAPGEDTFAKNAIGRISEPASAPGPPEFAQGYKITLDDSIYIEGVEIKKVSVWPSGSYGFEPGKDKMLNLLREPVYVTVSWSLPDGTGYTFGEKGTFAEVSLLQ